MSFILDALKKSETDRQQQGKAEFAGLPTSPDRREGMPAWMWAVGLLLLVNLAVLIGIFLRPDAEPNEIAAGADPTTQQEAPAAQQAAPTVQQPVVPADDDFAEQVAAARQNPPRQDDPPAVQLPTETVAAEPVASAPATSSSVSMLSLPTINEVRANGTVMLPDLHVDIHVYSENAEDRFVFINMAKHNEGSTLAEGPIVDEITPEGVVLRVGETRFLLPRD